MKQSTEEPQSAIFNMEQMTNRSFAIPLMSKKLNSIQKYVSSYKTNPRSIQQSLRNDKIQTMLSTHAEKLIFRGKLTPDPHVTLLNETKCYVKYLPLIQQKTEERLQQLDKIQIQYEHLKNNLNSNKDPYTSKFTIPLSRKRPIRNSQTSMAKIQTVKRQVDKPIKKQLLMEDADRQIIDLHMMKKDRIRLKDQIQKNRNFDIKDYSLDEQYKERENILLQKKTKQLQEKKNKLLKNKGLHWNVYYEMLALSKSEKQRVRSSNSHFVSTFGLN